MSDAHGHAEAHGEAHGEIKASAGSSSKGSMSDNWFTKIEDYVTGKIATFVAFLFLLITIGAFYGAIITGSDLSSENTVLLLAPAVIGLIAYTNRDIAVMLFIGLMLFFVFI